jgi:hypothetical protein
VRLSLSAHDAAAVVVVGRSAMYRVVFTGADGGAWMGKSLAAWACCMEQRAILVFIHTKNTDSWKTCLWFAVYTPYRTFPPP